MFRGGFVILFTLYLVSVTNGQEFLKFTSFYVRNPFFRGSKTTYNKLKTQTKSPAPVPAPSSKPTQPPVKTPAQSPAPPRDPNPPPDKSKKKSSSPARQPVPPPQGRKSAPRPPPAPSPAPKEPPKLTQTQRRQIARTVAKLKLTIKGKRVDPNTKTFQEGIAEYLYNQTVFERAKVWEQMAQLRTMFAKANKEKIKKSPSWDIEEVDGSIDDMIFDHEGLKDLLDFYAINNKYLKLDEKDQSTKEITARGAFKKKAKKWKMPIQYKIRSTKKRPVKSGPIKDAIAAWTKHTCLRFKKRGKNAIILGPNIIFRGHRNRCASRIGMKPFFQSIWLAPKCQKTGIVIHEIGHALGFIHEHQRPDRNKYVKIIKKNIKFGKKLNFIRFSSKWTETYGLPYDFSSIFHYHSKAFSKNKKKTIITKPPEFEKTIGQRFGLSFLDVKAANWRYCQKKCKGGLKSSKCKNGSYKNPKKCTTCVCPDGWRGKYCDKPEKSKPKNSSCGDTTLTAKTKKKSFTSPEYDKGGYTKEHECSWRIRAPSGQKVRLKFKGEFRLRCHTPCKDYVEVRYKSTSKPGPRYCCTKRPTKLFKSRKNVILINFRTYSGQGRKGFKVEYYTKTKPITAKNGEKKT